MLHSYGKMESFLEAIKDLQQGKTGTTIKQRIKEFKDCLLYTSPSPRD